MAQHPTREEFEAAARKVMTKAPAGLSREAFFKLIEQELNPAPIQNKQPYGGVKTEGDYVNPPNPRHEPDTYWGGFFDSLKKDLGFDKGQFFDMMKSASTPPQTKTELMKYLATYMLPSMGAVGSASNTGSFLQDAASRSTQALREAVQDIPKAEGAMGKAASAITTPARAVLKMKQALPSSFNFNELPLSEQMRRMGGDLEKANPAPATAPIRLKPATEPFGVPAQKGFNDLPLARQMELDKPLDSRISGVQEPPVAPATEPFGRPTQENFNDLPMFRQQELMENAGSRPVSGESRSPGPPATGRETVRANPAARPRLSGEKAPNLEDSLSSILDEVRESHPEDSRISNMPPPETVGEGATRQSGKFGKSGNKGQAGGYTSGRPGVTESQYDDLLDRFGGRGGAEGGESGPPLAEEPTSPLEISEDTLASARDRESSRIANNPSLMEPHEIFGGQKPSEFMEAEGGAHGVDNPINGMSDELHPGGMAGDAQDLRRLLGSRDAASELDVKPSAIKTMAPGPGRTPLAVEGRELDELGRNRFDLDKDPLLALLLSIGAHEAAPSVGHEHTP